MKRIALLCTLFFCVFTDQKAHAQDFSNKGKDFWVAYGYHERMISNSQEMVLYFATEAVTTVTVSIPGLGYTQTYTNIPANTVFTSATIPKAGGQDARLITETGTPEKKGIHITSDKPIVAYAHIYNASVSGATILFPTNTLGKEYYSINYDNISNTGNANCWFYVVACDTGTTTVEITPKANTLTRPAGATFTVNLNQGDVFNMMGQYSGNSGVDLTGSKIQSIDVGNGCKRIAVFSGSGRISLTCNGSSSSSDNYMVQAFPKSAWGKKFLTAPTGGTSPNNFFRICVTDPTTVVRVNGAVQPGPPIGNFYYQIGVTSTPNLIEADKPITVAQYLTSQGACGNTGVGDPEVIYLSPVEQNINKVLWNATSNFAITQHYINAIVPNTGTGITSFRLDGIAVSPFSFTPHPQEPGYSYLRQNVTAGQHTIQSDSGFNAIAYGYGSAESYGYNAGTNIKDLFQFVTIRNQHATVNFPTACKNSPFFFSMVFPYQPTSIQWQFNGLFPNVSVATPVFDSSWVVAGKTLYRYSLPTSYLLPNIGTYPIRIVASNPTPDGCGNTQEIDFDLQVFENPTAEFNFTTNGCLTTPVLFQSNPLNTQSRPIIKYWWDFADASGSALQNPSHTYSMPGTYNVRHVILTDVGCISDTLTHPVAISNPPVASFTPGIKRCAGIPLTFTDASTVPPGNTLSQWQWNFGDGNTLNATTGAMQSHTYSAPGLYTVTLKVVTSSGCESILFSMPVTINVNPVAGFNFPNICLPVGAAQFTNTTTISDGSLPLVTYSWNFGDGNSSTFANPLHNYSGTGPYAVTLTATSNNGCTDDSVRSVNTIYARPTANFTVDSIESCMGGTLNFTNGSTAPGSSVTQWFWDFGDATTSNVQNPNKQYSAPGNYTVRLWVNSAIGCRSDTMTLPVTVHQLPTVSFTNATSVCELGNLGLTSTSAPIAGTFTQYNWTVNGNPAGGNNSIINYIPTSSGAHTVNLTVLTSKGCSNQGSRVVTVNPKPVAGFNFPNICLPVGASQFTNTTVISDGSLPLVTYQWNFGDGNSSTQANPLHNYSGAGPFTVTLTAMSNNGCIDDSMRIVNTIYPEPQAAFNSSPEVCLGNSVTFTDQSTAGNATVNSWQWNFGDGNSSTLQSPIHTYATAGTFTVTLRVGTNRGCQTAALVATKAVIVNPLPTPDFNTNTPVCETRDITFTNLSTANAGSITTWRWNFGDGNSVVLNSGSPFIHNYTASGTYPLTLQVETNKGCISPLLSRNIIVNNRPKAGFISPEICLTDPFAPFTDTSKIAAGTITGWNWNFGDANANAGNPNTSTLQNPLHRYITTGSYTATLETTSALGCKDTIQQTFTVNGSIPVAGFTVNNTTALCSNRDIVIKDGSTVDFGNVVKVEIYWDFANDPTIKTTDDLPTPGKLYTHTYPEFGTPVTKTYTVRYVAYSGINCVNSFTQTITLLATPTVRFNTVNPVCDNVPSFTITQAGVTNALPGNGVFTGTGVSANGVFNPAIAGSGIHTITYTYTGTNGCVNTGSQAIRVNVSPNANAGPDKVVLEGGVVALTPALFAGLPVTYLWTPPTYLDNPSLPAAVVQQPSDDITYTLLVTTDQGCFDTDQVFVKLLKKPDVPNAFSPNGDGVHDTWNIAYLESYPGAVIDVYNRYGQLVYHSINYSTPWNGKISGRDAPIGTYYYIIDPKNGRKPITGFVDIVR